MRTVRVIVDPANAARDYRLPAQRAAELFDAGQLGQAQVRGDRWDYEDPQRRHAPEQVRRGGRE